MSSIIRPDGALPDEFVNILRDEEDPAILGEDEEEPLHGVEVRQAVPEERRLHLGHRHQGCDLDLSITLFLFSYKPPIDDVLPLSSSSFLDWSGGNTAKNFYLYKYRLGQDS